MPGLINGHGSATSVQDLVTYAAFGVTTVFSLGDEPADVFAAHRARQLTPLSHAPVFLSCPVLAPSSPDDAVAARNVDIAKIRVDEKLGTATRMRPDVYRAVTATRTALRARSAT